MREILQPINSASKSHGGGPQCDAPDEKPSAVTLKGAVGSDAYYCKSNVDENQRNAAITARRKHITCNVHRGNQRVTGLSLQTRI